MASKVVTPRTGGQELPDDVQDRPEQNRGYDEAVRGDERATQPQGSGDVDDDEFEDDEDDDADDEDVDGDPV